MAEAKSKARKLTSTDRKQLCKITEGRFEILANELGNRKRQIQTQIKKQVLAEHEKEIETFSDQLKTWKKDSEKLNKKQYKERTKLQEKKAKIAGAAKKKGLSIHKPGYGEVDDKILPDNLDKSVQERMNSVLDDYNGARTNLKTLELETLEKISVAGLETAEAQDFLTEIPDIDKLLPPPADIPGLIEAK